MEPYSDADVVAHSLHQPDAFAEIFERHFDAVYAYLARRVGVEVGGDLTAEVFLAAFESRRRYDLRRPVARPWLFGIATNVVHRHWRIERQRLRLIAKLERHEGAEAEADGAVARVDAEAAADEVASAVASLDGGSRDVLLLVAWGDLSYAEVAEALDIPVGTVRSRLNRARGHIRRHLSRSSSFPELTYPIDTGA